MKNGRILGEGSTVAVPARFQRGSIEILLPKTKGLAPEIYRQRLVLEGTCGTPIDGDAIRHYLTKLSVACNMRILLDPVTHRSDKYGWAGWVHWEASGAHFYAWEQPRLFFSVDIYACCDFDGDAVLEFTRTFFESTDLVGYQF